MLPHVAGQVLKTSEESLATMVFFLPSDLTDAEINKYSLCKLLEQEISLWEAVLNEWLKKIHEASIHVDVGYAWKGESVCSQYEGTWLNTEIKKLIAKRDQHVVEYHTV
jgi:hypothetical protein